MIKACAQHGANVAEIRDNPANDAILDIRQNNDGLIVSGGNDQAEEGKWVWPSDGRLFFRVTREKNGDLRRVKRNNQYVNWATSPQNDKAYIAPGFNGRDNCMTMVKSGSNARMWQDASCSLSQVLCEAPIVKGRATYLELVPPME